MATVVGSERKEEKGTKAYSTASLPRGFQFNPTDEQLVFDYLKLKNEGRESEVQIIGEVDFFDHEPWDLPDLSVIKSNQRESFFFCRCRRDAKVSSRRNRATPAGYWKPTGKNRSIQSSRPSCDDLIGTKKTLIFYKGRAPKGTRTDWIMHEYSATKGGFVGTSPHQDDFVLCRLLQNEWLGDKLLGDIKGEKIHHTGSSIITTNSSYIGVSDLASEAVLKDGLKDQEGTTMVSSPSVPSKRTRVLSGTQKFSCLVDGCKADLNMCREYHRRDRVCERHVKIPVAIVGGIEQRFCQNCRRFHSLGEFDELKGSCRSRMAGHVIRRIKSRPLYPSSKQFVSNYKEEGIEKRITESQGEVLGVEAFEMKSNSGEKNEEIEDTFPLHHLFKKERFADTEDDKIFHTCSFADPSDLTVDPVQQSEGTSTEPIPHFPAEEGIEKRITSESQRMVFEVEAIDMKSNSGEKIGVEFEAFGQDKIEEIGIEPETSDMDRKTLSMGLEKCSDTIIQREVLQSCLMWGGLGLTEPPKDEDWSNAKKIYLMDNELSDLPKNPRSPVLSTLFLQRNYKLRMIPPSFFYYMPALQILNLSRTGIKSLPESIIRLVSLKRLFLNDCHRFMILSPKVGELKRLEVLDIEGTDIMDLPNEIKELTNLKCLEVSFCTYLSNGRRAMQSDVVVPGGIILQLSHLEELNLSMNPDDKRWNACVEDIVTEVCTLESLNTLKFYFPRVELVRYFLLNSPMWVHPSLSNFRFTVGYHVKRTMSRLPGDVEFELEQWERCLKYINGVAVPREIQKVLQYSTAFFLERHATVKKLSDFGIGNMKQLKCCVVGECNEVEVIIDATDVYEEDSEADAHEEGGEAVAHKEDDEADAHEEDSEVDAHDKDSEADALEEDSEADDEVEAYREDGSNGIVPKTFGSKKIVLGSLEYLYIYYMKNLRRIWKGPVQPKCLSLLKSLTLRTCPQLTTIFTTGLLDNLYNLEELTVEDCPSIKTLVSCEISAEHKTSDFLPNLKRISLHYMPGLVSISSGLHIAPRLEWLSFYNCPNLKHLLIEEVSSKDLKKIKGEWNWWVALKWRCGRPSYLDDIFVPINI